MFHAYVRKFDVTGLRKLFLELNATKRKPVVLRETAALPCAKAHGKALYAHGKGSAVCRTQQRAYDIQTSAKASFAVCQS